MTDAAPWVMLLAEVLRSTPRLPDAACLDHRDLFASEDPDHVAVAIAVCRTCPELAACQRWASSQKPGRLHGVIAGRLHINPIDQPRKAKR